jgi:hypothetical protein
MRADLKVYRIAVVKLESHGGKAFDLSHERAEQARKAYEISRERFKSHLASHGCE